MSDRTPKPDAERITPLAHTRPEDRTADSVAPAGERSLLWVAIAVVGLLFCLVVLWLPSQLNERGVSAPAESSLEERDKKDSLDVVASKSDESQEAPDTEAVLAQRQAAQRIADALQLRRAELEKLSVSRWAAADYEQVIVNDERASDFFQARDFAAAATYWQKAIAQANTLLGQVEAVLKAAVVGGFEALDKLDDEAALEHFELALAIHPENAAAQVGMRRARHLPQILKLLAAAENHERDDSLDQAMMLYRQVLQLDPQSSAAKEGMVRAAQGMQDWEFRIALSTAQQALEAGDLVAAKREFQKADKIRPGDPAVKEGLAEIARLSLAREIVALEAEARKAVAEENWSAAVSHYRKILAHDSTLSRASSGLEFSRRRQALDTNLRSFIEQPDRLFSEEVLSAAKDTHRHALAIANPGPRLSAQISALQVAIKRASQPVSIRLSSDSSTSVMMYRVGRLGEFEHKELNLTPGSYTLVGRCEGYRDVRKTIYVPADADADADAVEPVDIRCSEKL